MGMVPELEVYRHEVKRLTIENNALRDKNGRDSSTINLCLREIHELKDSLDALKLENSHLREQLNEAHATNMAVHTRKGQLATQQVELVERCNNLLNEKKSLETRVEQLNSDLKAYQAGSNRYSIIVSELETKLANAQAIANRQRANAQRRAQRQQKYIDWLRSQNELLQNISGFGNQPRVQQDSARLKDPALREALTDAVTKDLKP